MRASPNKKIEEQEPWKELHRSSLCSEVYRHQAIEEIAGSYLRELAREKGIVLPFRTVNELLKSCLEPYIERARRIEEALKREGY